MPIQSIERVEFNPSNKEHLREYIFFVENNRWRTTCPFLLKEPHSSVPHMIERELSLRYVESKLKSELKSGENWMTARSTPVPFSRFRAGVASQVS